MNKLWLWILLLNTFAFQQIQAQVLPKPYLNYAEKGLVYHTTFMYKDFSFSGLMAVKEEFGSYHIILLSKMGVTIVDLLLTDEKLSWNKVPQAMDKRAIKHFMESDFNLLFLTALHEPEKYRAKGNKFKINNRENIKVTVSESGDKVLSAERKKFINFFKSKVTFFYTNNDPIPDEICLTHRNIRMKMEMSLLEQ